MDMGDILNQWDKMQASDKKKETAKAKAQVSHKKANAPTLEEKAMAAEKKFEDQMEVDNSRKVNIMEMWLRRYGTVDKDKIAEEQAERSQFYDRNYLINLKPEARLDLHGLHQNEAEQSLDRFITDCKLRGLHKVLIIHGKGIHSHGSDPVLGELVRRFIEHDKRCGASGHPKTKAEGGSGATWVILK